MTGIIKVASFNCRGLGRHTRDFINEMLDKGDIDILMLQETWLIESNLQSLANIHDGYFGYGITSIPKSDLLVGRPYGGLAFLWKKDLTLNMNFKVMETDSDRVLYMIVTMQHGELLLINLYLPVDNRSMTVVDNTFENCLTIMESVIVSHNHSDLIVGGDCNTDFHRRNAHSRYLENIIIRNDMVCVWNLQNIAEQYTYMAPNMTYGSCIDHFFVFENRSSAVSDLCVVGDSLNPSDHSVIVLTYKLDYIVRCQHKGKHESVTSNRIAWHMVTKHMYQQFASQVAAIIETLQLDQLSELFLCNNVACTDTGHIGLIEDCICMLNDIMVIVAESIFPKRSKKKKKLPYWNERIRPLKEQ